MKSKKIIFILIGPKGSGKSFIGDLFERYFMIRFVRVEKWAMEIKMDRKADDESYIKEFFETVERKIRDLMNHHNEIVFESTGLTPYFDAMYNHLGYSYDVVTIRIEANPQLCLKRVRKRNRSDHIEVSEDLVWKINQEIIRKNINCSFIIENSDVTEGELRSKIEGILKEVAHRS